MTREEFFDDVQEALRLLARLHPPIEGEIAGWIASMKAGRSTLTPADLRRYSDAIDWSQQEDARTLGELARVLLRLLAGLGQEVETFRRAAGGTDVAP